LLRARRRIARRARLGADLKTRPAEQLTLIRGALRGRGARVVCGVRARRQRHAAVDGSHVAAAAHATAATGAVATTGSIATASTAAASTATLVDGTGISDDAASSTDEGEEQRFHALGLVQSGCHAVSPGCHEAVTPVVGKLLERRRIAPGLTTDHPPGVGGNSPPVV
jgi:hypothetical protein